MPRYYFKKAYPKEEQEQSKDFFEIIPFTLLPPAGRGVSSAILSKQSSLNSTCKSKHNFAHFDRKAVFFGLKAQKHLARGRAVSVAPS